MKYYHNPKCSKSRQGLEYLKAKGVQVEIKEYIKEGLTPEEVNLILKSLNLSAKEFIRKKEAQKLEISLDAKSESELVEKIVQNPTLFERPVLLSRQKAVIGRPSENFDALF